MKILVIIEITEPLLMNTGFWETNQLSLLHTRHKITSSLKKVDLKLPGPGSRRHLSLYPFLWAIRPSVCGLAGRAYHCFPMLSSLWACPRPLHPPRWLEHGDVLRSYAIFKVHLRGVREVRLSRYVTPGMYLS